MSEIDHPCRYDMVSELHARPSPRLRAPAMICCVAFKEPASAVSGDRSHDAKHLGELMRRNAAPMPNPQALHHTVRVGRYELTWEAHTEFVSYTALRSGIAARPFDPAEGEIFAHDWQAAAPGRRIVAVLMQVEPLPADLASIGPRLARCFDTDCMTAVWVLDKAALVVADFRIDPAGFMRFLVFVREGVGSGLLGRAVQRLLELETYRAMAMLALPRARVLTAQLNQLDARLTDLAGNVGGDGRPPEQLLDELLDVSAELESLAARSAFRFGATRAYRAIVAERIETLRETRFENRQTLGEFMARRYEPAMRTVASAETRLQALLDRTRRVSELLRTRVNVARSSQSRDLLASMDRRADLQLRLQHTVEGLSVVAISYYAVGLGTMALAPLAEGAGVGRTTLSALLVPFAVAGAWYGLRRVRRRLHG